MLLAQSTPTQKQILHTKYLSFKSTLFYSSTYCHLWSLTTLPNRSAYKSIYESIILSKNLHRIRETKFSFLLPSFSTLARNSSPHSQLPTACPPPTTPNRHHPIQLPIPTSSSITRHKAIEYPTLTLGYRYPTLYPLHPSTSCSGEQRSYQQNQKHSLLNIPMSLRQTTGNLYASKRHWRLESIYQT